jgi:ATP-dependent protease ClpP protease subunit
MANAEPTPPQKTTLCFVGPILHPWTQCLRNVLCGLASSPAKEVVILFSSPGGSIFEGFALYNLIRTLPYEVRMHNIGSVQSIANIVFLAAKKRTAAPHSNFLLHNFTWTFTQETLTEPQVHERIMGLESARKDFIDIFEANTSIKAETFTSEKYFENPKVLVPAEAKNVGVIQDVLEHKVPANMPMINIMQGP